MTPFLEGYICVGRCGAPHGLRGELKIRPQVSDPEWPSYGPFYNAEGQPLPQATIRGAGTTMLVKFAGIDTPEAATKYKNSFLFATIDKFPAVEQAETYLASLYGQSVQDANGQVIGIVKNFYDAGSHPALVITLTNGNEAMVPYAAEYIAQENSTKGPLILTPAADGLLDLNT